MFGNGGFKIYYISASSFLSSEPLLLLLLLLLRFSSETASNQSFRENQERIKTAVSSYWIHFRIASFHRRNDPLIFLPPFRSFFFLFCFPISTSLPLSQAKNMTRFIQSFLWDFSRKVVTSRLVSHHFFILCSRCHFISEKSIPSRGYEKKTPRDTFDRIFYCFRNISLSPILWRRRKNIVKGLFLILHRSENFILVNRLFLSTKEKRKEKKKLWNQANLGSFLFHIFVKIQSRKVRNKIGFLSILDSKNKKG